MSDIYEVEAGKIANEKGKSEQVKQFGQQMVETHTKTTEELEGIVEPEKIKVDLPTKVDDKHQGMTCADQQQGAHKTAVALFEAYSKGGRQRGGKGDCRQDLARHQGASRNGQEA
jgi:putative membrane protein